jgi:transitional endoplasmic reticulum ATPase
MPHSPPQLQAQVGDAPLDDVAEGRARLSRDLFEGLRLTAGARVRIAGAEPIIATAYPGGPEDDGLGLVRLDGVQRRRLGVEVGGTVSVQPVERRIATKVRLVALGDTTGVELPLDAVRARLAEHPVIVGDTILVTPRRKRLDASLSVLGLNVAGVVGSISDAEGVLLRVSSTTPGGVVEVDASTEIEMLESSAATDDEMDGGTFDGAHDDSARGAGGPEGAER